ncbi:MAG: YceI family protein [Corynebacterium sp.]|nr:YceI family protein [Corynebacterium sp.]
MNSRQSQPIFVYIVIAAIFVLTLCGIGAVTYNHFHDHGLKTASLDDTQALAASTDVNGDWNVIDGSGPNRTSVGYTFHELLPGQSIDTSGSTNNVTGDVKVENNQLTSGKIVVDMTTLKTDQEKRDINVRSKILHTDDYPTATFEVTSPVDLSSLPGDGTSGHVTIQGNLTIMATTKPVTADFKVLRTGTRVILGTTIPFDRTEFGVDTPEFVAAKIDTQGELNVLITMEKQS